MLSARNLNLLCIRITHSCIAGRFIYFSACRATYFHNNNNTYIIFRVAALLPVFYGIVLLWCRKHFTTSTDRRVPHIEKRWAELSRQCTQRVVPTELSISLGSYLWWTTPIDNTALIFQYLTLGRSSTWPICAPADRTNDGVFDFYGRPLVSLTVEF